MICFKVSVGISSPTNCFMASYAISSLLKFSIFSKKSVFNGVMDFGKYNPLSDANPFITASSKETSGALWFKL